jgi:hypothetical protein
MTVATTSNASGSGGMSPSLTPAASAASIVISLLPAASARVSLPSRKASRRDQDTDGS